MWDCRVLNVNVVNITLYGWLAKDGSYYPLRQPATKALYNTRRGRSWAQHIRDREADIERAKNWHLAHLQCSKGEPAGPSPHLGCVFVQRRRKRRMARPEGPSRCFGFGSFVQERWSSGEARRAGPRSPLSWRLIKNAKFQLSSSRHRVFPRELIRHSVVDCPLCFAANHITAF